ncbi:MAG: Uma2 family endonuclease, partial [Deltaproteobacteria bacterium]|nr:Uma2 family endonuclease [Deltaproteobacteria bacterium]
ATPGARNPFRLGFRERRVTTPDGRRVLAQIPLTAEDLVYPQEGDHVTQGMPHFSFLLPQADAMRRYLEKRPGIVVTSDVTLVLRHDGKNCGPDVAVIEGDFDPDAIPGAIQLREVGGRLAFALEAVSTSEREIEDKDLKRNLVRYAREGVEEYFTLYPVLGRRVRGLVGRRLVRGEWVEIPPDAEGRVVSRKL